MKKNKLNMVVAIALCVSLGLSSCIGSFKLTNKVLGWNEGVGNKFVNELVFIAFHIIPVYELTVVADILVLNSIEFWSGENLVSQSTKEVKGENGGEMVPPMVSSDAASFFYFFPFSSFLHFSTV